MIFGDEVEALGGTAPSEPDYQKVRYRGRVGEWNGRPSLRRRSTEMYFPEVGQGDPAFVVTPNNTNNRGRTFVLCEIESVEEQGDVDEDS